MIEMMIKELVGSDTESVCPAAATDLIVFNTHNIV